MRGRRGRQTARRLGLWALAAVLACISRGPGLLPPEALRPLEARAERARGLLFVEPVEARVVSRGRVEALLAESIGRVYTPELRRADETVKKTLGLLPADADLWEASIGFQSRAVSGLYAPLEGRLYVVSEAAPDPGEALLDRGVDQVLVHELVHALQALHSDLIDVILGLVDHDDLSFALGALLEGDATWAGYRDDLLSYGLPMPSPEQVASDFGASWSGEGDREVPRLVREGLVLLYPAGYALVTRILDAGGVAALDAALLDPPLTSREILHPERYLDSSRRSALLFLQLETGGIAPSPECTIVGANTFGEFGLRIWAQERGMDGSAAAAAAEGWEADRAVVFDCPTGPAFAWLVQLATAARAREFAETVSHLARQPTRVESWGNRVLLWANLSQGGRSAALFATESRAFRDLAEYLDARPEILERTRALRSRFSAGGAGGGPRSGGGASDPARADRGVASEALLSPPNSWTAFSAFATRSPP